MTETLGADATPAASQQPQQPLSVWGKIHVDARRVWDIASRMFPLMEKIALNPALDSLFEEALLAADDGVAAEAFAAATDALRGARYRQAGGRPQPLAAVAAEPQPAEAV